MNQALKLFGLHQSIRRGPHGIAVFLALSIFAATLILWVGGAMSFLPSEVSGGTRFPEAFEVSSQGSFLRIEHGDDLQPQAGEDFLVLAWFNLKRLPAVGQQLVLLSKYDPEDGRGYGLGLSRDEKGLRPMVYFADADDVKKMSAIRHATRWYEFPDLDFPLTGWFMFALTLHDDKLLGAHMARFADQDSAKAELHLLGGYDVGEMVPPLGTSDLIVGAFQDRLFRGEVGPLAIARGRGLADRFKDIFKQSTRHPLEVVDEIPRDWLKLWVPNQQGDRSDFSHSIEFNAGRIRKIKRENG